MPAAVRTYLTTGLALMGAGFVTAAQTSPPLHQAQTRVVEAAVTLAAAVGNGLPCSGYNTDGCDISAPQSYTPIALDPAGSSANIAANIVNAVASIPRAVVDAINGLSYAFEVTGSWWVYSPTNVLGVDPADQPKITALVDLAIPFKPISNAVGDQVAWWARANLPMDAGCTANAGPHCADADAIFAKMFLAPIWTLASGYQFPTVINPISDAEGAATTEIPGSEGTEVAWSGAYVKLNLLDPLYSLINYLQADPSTNAPKQVTGAEIAATLDRLGKALALDFNPFVPGSYLLKGWPYTALTPLFKPFVPIFCKTCNPADPGGPAITPPAQSAAATLVSSETPAAVEATESVAPAVDAGPQGDSPADPGDPGRAKADAVPAVAVEAPPALAGITADAEDVPEVPAAVGSDAAEAGADAAEVSGLAKSDAPSAPVSKPRGGRHGSRTSAATAGAAAADQGASATKASARAAAAGE